MNRRDGDTLGAMGNKKYGLVVIGGGMAGLGAALAWTRVRDVGREPVLVLEKESTVGGCVTSFARGGYRFDTVQVIPDVSDLLRFFGFDIALDRYEPNLARLILADPARRSCTAIPIAADRAAFERDLRARYPEDADRIAAFFSYGDGLLAELPHLKTEPSPLEGIGILVRCPRILAQSKKTYRQYLDAFGFTNPELLEVLDLFSSFSALSGDRCAALLTACAMMTTLRGGFRPHGGFIGFPAELRRRAEDAGVEVRVRSPVDRIVTHNGAAVGVRSRGEYIAADNVVCTADTFATFEELVGEDVLKKAGTRYWRKFKSVKPGPSSFAIHLGLEEGVDLRSLGLDSCYNVLTTGRASHELLFREWEAGRMLMDEGDFHFAAVSPSVVVGGKPTLILHVVPAATDDWLELRERDRRAYDRKKQETADFYLAMAERYLVPGLSSRIRLIDIATPATYARYLGSRGGSTSDMVATPSNFGMYRLPARTPIRGLFLPKFSQGIWPALTAGLQVVDMISGGQIMRGNASYAAEERIPQR